MAIDYLFDTNIVIYYLQQQLSKSAETVIDNILLKSQPIISSITEIVILCWKAASDKDLIVLKNFVEDSLVHDLDHVIKYKTIEIRKQYSVKLPDAIIAATAIVNDLTLLIRNSKDFKNIDKLNIVNPFD